MAVKMRLRRMGQKKAPFYRVVVADSRSPRDGRFIEEVGYYNPTVEPSVIKFDEELTKKWLSQGAQPTDRVAKLLKNAGIE
jgi:ribosomal protein S16